MSIKTIGGGAGVSNRLLHKHVYRIVHAPDAGPLQQRSSKRPVVHLNDQVSVLTIWGVRRCVQSTSSQARTSKAVRVRCQTASTTSKSLSCRCRPRHRATVGFCRVGGSCERGSPIFLVQTSFRFRVCTRLLQQRRKIGPQGPLPNEEGHFT